MKLCIIGDSIGKGIVFDAAAGRYVSFDENFVNQVAQKEGLSVENLCRFGNTVTNGMRLIERNEEKIASSDLVLLEFGGNDSDYDWSKIAEDPDRVHQPRTPIKIFTETYRKIIAELRRLGKTPLVLNLPPVDAGKYFRWISRGLSESNILKWLNGDRNYIYRWHEMYNAAVCDLCVTEGLPLADIRSPFLFRQDYSRLLCEDGIHPNEGGHKMIAETMISFLKKG